MSTALKELSKFTNVHMCSFRSRSFTVMVNNKRVDNEVLSEVPGTGGLLGRIVRVNSAIEKTTQNVRTQHKKYQWLLCFFFV